MKLIASFLLLIASVCSAEIPKKVEIIVPYGVGGASDQAARHFQSWMISKQYSAIIVNRPGANGTIAMNDLSQGSKDGSVISFSAAGVIALAENRANKKLVTPLTISGITVHAFITNPNSNYQNLSSLEKGLKVGNNDIMIGWFAVGNVAILNQIYKKLKLEKEPLLIPFKTSTETAQNVVGNHIPMALVPMIVAKPLIDDGKLKLITAVGPSNFKLPKGMTSITQRFPDWNHQDGFVVALPYGVPEHVEKSWTNILQEYFSQKETDKFYEELYIAKAVFGKKAAEELIGNAEDTLKKFEDKIK
jgi:tripartite-type tricarboxylate transporter receptor subunit TctC